MVGKFNQFQNGDFIVPAGRQSMIFILKQGTRFEFDFCLKIGGNFLTHDEIEFGQLNVGEVEFRSATPWEIREMLIALLKRGCVWDFLRRRVVYLDDTDELFYRAGVV